MVCAEHGKPPLLERKLAQGLEAVCSICFNESQRARHSYAVTWPMTLMLAIAVAATPFLCETKPTYGTRLTSVAMKLDLATTSDVDSMNRIHSSCWGITLTMSRAAITCQFEHEFNASARLFCWAAAVCSIENERWKEARCKPRG